MPRICWCLIVLPTLLLAGCPDSQGTASDAPGTPTDPLTWNSTSGDAASNTSPGSSAAITLVQLDVYQLTVPFGDLSRDAEFWKRVDETQLDMPTYDLLLKNGIRVGIGADDDWLYFKTLIDQYQATCKPASSSVTDGGYIDLPLHEKVEYQDIFYFNERNALTGRTYINCEDLLSVAFFAAKRNSGETLIKVCPVIHGLTKRLEVTQMGNELEIDDSHPERLFDLHLEALVPAKHFLLIAPSREARYQDLIGSAFLDGQSSTNRTETVLLLVPHEVKLKRLVDKTVTH